VSTLWLEFDGADRFIETDQVKVLVAAAGKAYPQAQGQADKP
jgi:hypothetical protein